MEQTTEGWFYGDERDIEPPDERDYDEVSQLRTALAERDAEIERLRAVVDALHSIGSIRLLRNSDWRVAWMMHATGMSGVADMHEGAIIEAAARAKEQP